MSLVAIAPFSLSADQQHTLTVHVFIVQSLFLQKHGIEHFWLVTNLRQERDAVPIFFRLLYPTRRLLTFPHRLPLTCDLISYISSPRESRFRLPQKAALNEMALLENCTQILTYHRRHRRTHRLRREKRVVQETWEAQVAVALTV